jgi:hypothetical protein
MAVWSSKQLTQFVKCRTKWPVVCREHLLNGNKDYIRLLGMEHFILLLILNVIFHHISVTINSLAL